MKPRILLILLLVSSFSFAQTWNQVGATQFTNFATDASISFDAAGIPYLAYINPAASNKIYVKKFDGTNWVDLTVAEVSTEASANVVIKINPVTNEPTVAYRRVSDNTFDVYRFDGTSWIAVTTAEGAGDLLDVKLQMQFNASGNIRIAGQYNLKAVHFYTQTTGTWTVNNYGHSVSNITQMTVDFVNYEQFFYQYDNYSASYFGKRTVSGSTLFAQGLSSRNFREISGISDENIVAANNLSGYSGAIWFSNGATSQGRPLNTNGSKIGYLKLRKSPTDTNYYLMFADSNDDLVFQKYKRSVSQWFDLPSVGISTTTTNFFASMEMNVVDGNMYLLYLDGAKVSVKKYSIPVEVPKPRIFVDVNATGNNDGTSFTDAYTTLQDGLANIEPVTTEIWIAAGRYTPHASNRSSSFTFSKENLKIYGGFNGTETSISQRNITANPSILSGDLENDGNTGSNLFDNSFHVTKITANGIIIDGVTIRDGASTETTGSNSRGSAIEKADAVTTMTLKNTTILNNYGTIACGLYASFSNGGDLTIENCIFSDNDSRYGSGFYALTGDNQTLNVKVTNSLFENNRSRNFGSTGYAGSAFWIRANGANSIVDAKITNCTFSKNIDIGTATVAERATVGMGKSATGSFTADVSNCIFYGNTTTGGAVSISIGRVHTNAPGFTGVNNSIGEDGFSNLTYLTNTSNANPMFMDTANDDFTLTSSSPAIDSGDNTKIPAGVTTDLLGNQRIFNTTVDMGAYEYGSTLDIEDFETKKDFIIYPNPTSNTLNIKMPQELFKAEIFNVQGQKVLESTNKRIEVSNLAAGMYLLQMEDIAGNRNTKRFIKN